MSRIITVVMLAVLYHYAIEIFPPTKDYPAYVHKTLYLDRNFSEDEAINIIEAALTWAEKTNHTVNFDVVILPSKNKIEPEDAVIIYIVSQDNPEIMILDAINQNTTLGYCDQSGPVTSIALVNDRIDDNLYISVVEHELGHALGLKHNEGFDGKGTLMYPSVEGGSTRITFGDLINFCHLYHCDVDKFK